MRVVNVRCAGLDVHQKTVVACRLYEDEAGRLWKDVCTFEAMTDGLLAMSDWLSACGITHVAMESTGELWKPVYTILEGNFEIVVANAQHMKTVPGRKTDVNDAEWSPICCATDC